MSRFSRYDTDEERLPEGMQRVGYDADTQVYTFRDADGSYWESAPGNEYGQLTKVGEARPEGQETETFLMTNQQQRPKMTWFTEMKPFLNFLMLVILSLVLLFWFLGYKGSSSDERIPIADCPEGTVAYAIHKSDTCWEIANKNGVSVDDLKNKNPDLNCEALKINDRICVPGKKSVD